MPIQRIKSKNEFEDIIFNKGEKNNNKYILIDFYASWCKPCKKIAPILGELSEKYKDITYLKIDIDECEEIADIYKIRKLPTFITLKSGSTEEKFKRITGTNEKLIETRLQSLSELDIDDDF